MFDKLLASFKIIILFKFVSNALYTPPLAFFVIMSNIIKYSGILWYRLMKKSVIGISIFFGISRLRVSL